MTSTLSLISIVALFLSPMASSAAVVSHEVLKLSATGEGVEFYWSKPAGLGPFPALLMIHPDQDSPKDGGESFVKNGQLDYWTQKGYATIAVSQPGYGRSQGSADFCGPKTQRAVMDVIKHFQSEPEIDSKRFFVYGGSRGAVVASMIATEGLDVRGFILKSGVYDLVEWSQSRPWYDAIKLTMVWEIGWPSPEKLIERSAAYLAGNIKAPVMLIHGTKDNRAPLYIAEIFAEKINAAGGKAQLIKMESEHVIPMPKVDDLMETFMGKFR